MWFSLFTMSLGENIYIYICGIQYSHYRTLLSTIKLNPKDRSLLIKRTKVHIIPNRMAICDVFWSSTWLAGESGRKVTGRLTPGAPCWYWSRILLWLAKHRRPVREKDQGQWPSKREVNLSNKRLPLCQDSSLKQSWLLISFTLAWKPCWQFSSNYLWIRLSRNTSAAFLSFLLILLFPALLKTVHWFLNYVFTFFIFFVSTPFSPAFLREYVFLLLVQILIHFGTSKMT